MKKKLTRNYYEVYYNKECDKECSVGVLLESFDTIQKAKYYIKKAFYAFEELQEGVLTIITYTSLDIYTHKSFQFSDFDFSNFCFDKNKIIEEMSDIKYVIESIHRLSDDTRVEIHYSRHGESTIIKECDTTDSARNYIQDNVESLVNDGNQGYTLQTVQAYPNDINHVFDMFSFRYLNKMAEDKKLKQLGCFYEGVLFINLTPHNINVYFPGEEPTFIIPRSQYEGRVKTQTEQFRRIGDIVITHEIDSAEIVCTETQQTYDILSSNSPIKINFFTDYKIVYIVSRIFKNCLNAMGEGSSCFIVPSEMIRDSEGAIIGCRGFSL